MKNSMNIKGRNKLSKEAVEKNFANIHSLQNSMGGSQRRLLGSSVGGKTWSFPGEI